MFDESLWSDRTEVGIILIWTAIEILFDLGGAQHDSPAARELSTAPFSPEAIQFKVDGIVGRVGWWVASGVWVCLYQGQIL